MIQALQAAQAVAILALEGWAVQALRGGVGTGSPDSSAGDGERFPGDGIPGSSRGGGTGSSGSSGAGGDMVSPGSEVLGSQGMVLRALPGLAIRALQTV